MPKVFSLIGRWIVPHFLFWASHALGLLICFVVFAALPRGEWAVAAFVGLPTLILIAGVVIGGRYLSSRPGRLLTLLYGVESPLVLALFWLGFAVAQPQPAALLALALPCGAAGVVAWNLWRRPAVVADGDAPTADPATVADTGAADHVGETGPLGWLAACFAGAAALYVGLLAVIVLTPVFVQLAIGFFSLEWLDNDHGLGSLLGIGLALYFGAMMGVVLLQLALPAGYFAAELWRAWRGLAAGARRRAFAQLLALTATVFGAIWLLNRQEHREVLAAAAEPGQIRELTSRRPERLREGLLDVYLASFRYLAADDPSSRLLSDLYETRHFGETLPRLADSAVRTLAGPWLYQGGDLRGEQLQAAQLYETVFDAPIQEAEQPAIEEAMAADWRVFDGAKYRPAVAAERQEIRLRENDGWAEVEILEVLVNRTWDNQEVVYEFSLPAHAALTGVWLGGSADRGQRFEAVVAPRGAAARVYRQEVERRVDPALLEEVGRGAYRLRVYPVLPSDRGTPGPPLYVWWTFQLMDDGQAWTLPRLRKSRNVEWRDAERYLLGKKRHWPADAWLPASLPRTPVPLRRQLYAATVGAWRIEAKPLPTPRPAWTPRQVAVVVDTSFSMSGLDVEVKQALAELRAGGASLTCFFAESGQSGREADAAALAAPPYFGHLGFADLFGQFAAWRGDRRFDATLLLTDQGGADVASWVPEFLALPEPTWLVHLGGRWPNGHSAQLRETLERTGGGLAPGLEEVFDQWRWPPAEGAEVVGGYLFTFGPQPGAAPTRGGFEAIAGHQLIHHLARGSAPSEIAELDALHQIAVAQRVVSPLSSMLVLVEERQLRALEAESAQDDRFEPETAGTGATPDHPFGLSAVPEPEEWALLAVAVGLLLFLRRWQS